jgi:hypothetical protein
MEEIFFVGVSSHGKNGSKYPMIELEFSFSEDLFDPFSVFIRPNCNYEFCNIDVILGGIVLECVDVDMKEIETGNRKIDYKKVKKIIQNNVKRLYNEFYK